MTTGRVIFDVEGMRLTSEDKSLLRHPECAGIIFFARQDAGRAAIQSLVNEIREVNPHVLIAVDQEGGRVQRFKREFSRLPKPSYYGKQWASDPEQGVTLARQAGELMAKELRAVGVDISFAPVVDRMCYESALLADRVFSDTPEGIVTLAGAFMQGMHAAQMPATLKHFPGHGGVSLDSHLTLPEDSRDRQALETDIQIFKQLMAAGAEAIMPAHIVFPKIDKLPVGFSSIWLKQILREEMGYQGIVFSDDLTMKATEAYGNYTQRAQLAVQAGCDFILVCQNRSGAIETLDAMKDVMHCPESQARCQHYLKQLSTARDEFSVMRGE